MTTGCDYLPTVIKIGERLGIGTWDINVRHDDWCPMVGGDGSKKCKPDYYVLGRKVQP